MIVFDVKCGNQHVFEGWFADSNAFDEQVRDGILVCPICGDGNVEKALMAPNIATGGNNPGDTMAKRGNDESDAGGDDSLPAVRSNATPEAQVAAYKEKTAKLLATMRAFKAHVERNFDDVDVKFAEEARKIHYGESEKRNIYGKATEDEARALQDEGIEFGRFPDIPDSTG